MTAEAAPDPHPSGPGDPDDAMVIRESMDDPDRFHLIFDRHANAVYRYLARRLEPSVAEDVVGETFLLAFRQRTRYEAKHDNARPWLYGIATNLLRRYWRDEARAYRMLQRAGTHARPEDHDDAVAATVTAQSTRAQLGRALKGLRKGDRDVLLLIAWEELSYQEVAEALAIPIGTVRSRMNRARRKVRDALDETNASLAVEELSYG